jgi:acyl-coenzyme A synthetase/AMP-(fatty) acid ligase/acyl carrier protein
VTFDTSVKQIVQLLSGHCLHVIPDDIRFDGRLLLEHMRAERIDVLDCTPSQLTLLLEAGLLTTLGAPRLVLIGGEALDVATWRLLAEHDGITFVNLYGPTECTVDATVCRIASTSDPPSIGRPVANTEVYVLDEHRLPVPIGIPGELYIGGLGLARGYRGRADLTAERFVAHPFQPPPARLYRSGDRVRYRGDGQLEFLGRLDDQIKLRGFRIEPGEIEAALRQQPAVADACVVASGDDGGPARLVGYLVARSPAGESIAADALSRFLCQSLPDYMVPAAYVWLPALPRTSRGKIDRRALPAPDKHRPALAREFVGPRNPNERAVAAMWEQLLEVEPIGIYDDFFSELGGHSLMATRLVSRVRDAFGVELPLRWVFERPSIAGLVAAIEEAKAAPLVQALPALTAAPRDRHRSVRRADGRLEWPEALKVRQSGEA